MSRKLDTAIAELLGYEVILEEREYGMRGNLYHIKTNNGRFKDLPHYRTDGNAMLELDKEMRERGWEVEITYSLHFQKYIAKYYKPETRWRDYIGEAAGAPEAVAFAAYKALTGKE